MRIRLIFFMIFIMTVAVVSHNVNAQRENIVPSDYSNQESKNFEAIYDPSVFGKREVKKGLVILEQFLKEECVKSSFCLHPNYKIPIVYLNQKGPELGSSNLRGFTTTINEHKGIVIYGGTKKIDDYLRVEDILRHEICHILICLPEHWANEGYATLSENNKKGDDRLKFAYLAQNKLPQVKILEEFFMKYDLSNFDNFLKIMGADRSKAYYGISFSLTSWLIEKTGSRDNFIKFMNELGNVTKDTENWKEYAPEEYKKLGKNGGAFNWSIIVGARSKYVENYLTPRYFGKKETLSEMEKEWRVWTTEQFQERFPIPLY